MKKKFIASFLAVAFVLIFVFSGCSEDNSTPQRDDLKSVEHIGEVPFELKNVVENDLFRYAVAYEGSLLKHEACAIDEDKHTVDWQVQMIDAYGNNLAEYSFSFDDTYDISTLTATDDGGFLFVLGFSDRAYDENAWASDKGFASRVVKCDKTGKLQFETTFDGVQGSALKQCFEKNGLFYFFGEIETPETKVRGVHSPTDIYMVILDGNGNALKNKCFVGSNFDSLGCVEMTDDGFIMSVRSASDDGNYVGTTSNGYPVYWKMTVDDNLELIEKKNEQDDHSTFYNDIIGEKNGVAVYRNNPMFDSFDAETAGAPMSFVDYGDFYMIVSVNNTGIYENAPPEISRICYYTETVYSAYDYTGKMLFRTSVDSSPDYEEMFKAYNNASA